MQLRARASAAFSFVAPLASATVFFASFFASLLSLSSPALAGDAAAKPAPAAPAKSAAAPAATGSIRGTVEFTGKAPEQPILRRDSDPVCAAVEKRGEDIVVTKGKLAGVLVRIKNGTAGSHAAPSEPAVVIQRECTYEPRVTGVLVGQKVAIKNADETYHNVRATRGDDYMFNLSQPARAPDIVRDDFKTAGATVSLHCDVHPWMNAFIVVQDHPFFAVTAADGSFTLANVPPGSYELEAWHPVLGLRTSKVKVGKGKAAAKLRFSAPKPSADSSK